MRQKFELFLENILGKYNIYGDYFKLTNVIGYLSISYSLLYLLMYFYIQSNPMFIFFLILNIGFYLYTFFIFSSMKDDYKWNSAIQIVLGFLFVLNMVANLFICFIFFGTIVAVLLLAIFSILSYSNVMLFLIPIAITFGIILLLKNKEKSSV